MFNFTFHRPTRLLFGEGQIANIAHEIPEDARLMITYGGGSIKKNGVLDQVHQALAAVFSSSLAALNPTQVFQR